MTNLELVLLVLVVGLVVLGVVLVVRRVVVGLYTRISEQETHHKFLAVGKSMVSSLELENMEKGEVIQNTHYISDKFWETGKTIYD